MKLRMELEGEEVEIVLELARHVSDDVKNHCESRWDFSDHYRRILERIAKKLGMLP